MLKLLLAALMMFFCHDGVAASANPLDQLRCRRMDVVMEWPKAEPGAKAEVWWCGSRLAAGLLAEGRDRVTEEPEEDAGLNLYWKTATEIMPRAWVVPLLFPHLPGLDEEQQEWFKTRLDDAADRGEIFSATGRRQWSVLRAFLKRHKRDPRRLRMVLLHNGYLFFSDPYVARRAYRALRIGDFFGRKESVVLQRGDEVYPLRRRGRDYIFTTGPRRGVRARLLPNDRLGTKARSRPLAWDLEPFRRAAGLTRFAVRWMDGELLEGAAYLRAGPPSYDHRGPLRIPALAFRRGGRPVLILISRPSFRAPLEAALGRSVRDRRIARGILAAAVKMVDERLRFDEPLTEEGQQDGSLRPLWLDAYRYRKDDFEFNGDTYPVFTRGGAPRVPQVCIEFVLDSAERWSGTWFNRRGKPRRWNQGFLFFPDQGLRKTRVKRLLAYAREHPGRMGLIEIPEEQRIPYRRRSEFQEAVRSYDLLPGDVIAIYGLRADNRNHWHSFYLYDTDPVFGWPILLVGNDGLAQVKTWHDVMRTAPRRYLRARIRFLPDWLASLHEAWDPSKLKRRFPNR